MFTTIALAIAAIAGGITVYNYWPEIRTWLSDFVSALANLFSTVFKGVAYATAVFVRIVKDGVAEVIHRTYVPTEETAAFGEITTRRVTAIPAWAQEEIEREQRNGKEVRVTKEMAQRLGLSI